jgi:hypothetical protein
MEISFLFFLHRLADENGIAGRCGDFVDDDQSRIAGVCREIRSVDFLELTLCANWRQRTVIRRWARKAPDQATNILRRTRRSADCNGQPVRLRRRFHRIKPNSLAPQAFLHHGQRGAMVDLLAAKTIESDSVASRRRNPPRPKSTMEMKE